MQLKGAHNAMEASRMLNAFVLFREEGMQAVLDTFPEYKKFVANHKESSVRQVKNILFPTDKSKVTKD